MNYWIQILKLMITNYTADCQYECWLNYNRVTPETDMNRSSWEITLCDLKTNFFTPAEVVAQLLSQTISDRDSSVQRALKQTPTVSLQMRAVPDSVFVCVQVAVSWQTAVCPTWSVSPLWRCWTSEAAWASADGPVTPSSLTCPTSPSTVWWRRSSSSG